MGTNYYSAKWGIEELDDDAFWDLRDGEGDTVLHIGKSSGGWFFSFYITRLGMAA